MPGPLHVRPSVVIPEGELSWRFSRSGGPGGQSVNTTDSRVELSWNVAESTALPPVLKARALRHLAGRLVDGRVLTVAVEEHRSQLRNRAAAEARLAALVATAIAPPPKARRPTRPSEAAAARRIAAKRRRGELKRARRATGSEE